MLRVYHIFEMSRNGTLLWRACISGRANTERKLQEFAEQSEHEFIALDFSTSNFLRLGAAGTKRKPKIQNVRPTDRLKADPLPASVAKSAMAQPERRSRGT
jgi:hypothetical protein